jgi:uncharacterized protein (TIGR03437 family)
MIQRLAIFVLIAAGLNAAEFQNGQAARAVIGQPSFSSRDAGPAAIALTVSGDRLYAADASRHLLTFDLTKVRALNIEAAAAQARGCAVCGFPAIASISQSVMPGLATIAMFGKTVIMADAARHRVLIWKDVSLPRSSQGPDIILGRSGESPVSAGTLANPVSVAFDGRRLFVGDAALHRVLIWNSLPTQDDQPADAVLGQPNFTSTAIAEIPGPDTIRDPAALASDGTNLFVADAPDRRILVFTPGDFPLAPVAVVNSASLAPGPLAPGTLINIKLGGSVSLSDAQQDGTGQRLSKKLSGVEVLLDGVALPLLSVSSTRIEAQLPYGLPADSSASLYIRSEHEGANDVSNAVALRIAPAAPGLYAFGGTEPRTGLLLHAAPSESGLPGAPVTADSPARPGEELTLWATGLGLVNDSSALSKVVAGVPFSGPDAPVLNRLTALVDDQPVEVQSARLTEGAVGVYEIHILLPGDFVADPDAELVISQNGHPSNTIRFPLSSARP